MRGEELRRRAAHLLNKHKPHKLRTSVDSQASAIIETRKRSFGIKKNYMQTSFAAKSNDRALLSMLNQLARIIASHLPYLM